MFLLAMTALWCLALVIPLGGVKVFLGTNVEDNSFIEASYHQASSQTVCVLLCHADPNCSLVKFTEESGLCNRILRDESSEPRLSDAGGIKVFVDKNKPCKYTNDIPYALLPIKL